MDLSWSTTPRPEAFKRPNTATETLTRLASFIARAECKPGLHRTQRPPPDPPTPAPDPPFTCTDGLPLTCTPGLNCTQRNSPDLQRLAPELPFVDLPFNCNPGLNCSQRPLLEPLNPVLNLPDDLPFTCNDCGQKFTYATELLIHQDTDHALPKPHQCLHCLQEFSLKSSLQMHNCEFFQGQMSDGPSYATTLTSVSENPTNGCVFAQPYVATCGKDLVEDAAQEEADSDATLTAPSQSDNPESQADSQFSEEEEETSSSTSLYGESRCKFCSRTFRSEAAFNRHKQLKQCNKKEKEKDCLWGSSNVKAKRGRMLKKGVFSCRSCDKVFNSTAKLYNHRKEKHSRSVPCVRETIPAAKKKHKRHSNCTYTCQICSKVFLHHLSLWAHTRKHPKSANESEIGKSMAAKNATENGKFKKQSAEKTVEPIKITFRKNMWTRDFSIDKKIKPRLKLRRVTDRASEKESDEEVEFPCASCPQVFEQLSELRAHAELHQMAVSSGRCSVCDCHVDSSNWAGAKRSRLYHCALCQRGFSTLELFLSHCQEHLKAKVEEEWMNGETTDT
ncbi:hypothetical protein WMY93_027173 [Mugilogobius chulae]|uniref:C2H2-type domain-containing protein n=1 Tax=Mugilogobius chulae TaxID=88201 RepID=A0AAW0N337_9GOBI